MKVIQHKTDFISWLNLCRAKNYADFELGKRILNDYAKNGIIPRSKTGISKTF